MKLKKKRMIGKMNPSEVLVLGRAADIGSAELSWVTKHGKRRADRVTSGGRLSGMTRNGPGTVGRRLRL